jgi:hypothetical protein
MGISLKAHSLSHYGFSEPRKLASQLRDQKTIELFAHFLDHLKEAKDRAGNGDDMNKTLLLIFLLLTPVIAFADPSAKADRPNIVFLFADDQRADTIGAHGNPHIQTPNLDRLAAKGFSFRRNYCAGSFSGAVCVASRAMLMTGRHWMNLAIRPFVRPARKNESGRRSEAQGGRRDDAGTHGIMAETAWRSESAKR